MWKKQLSSILEKANITINGQKPYDIQIHDDRLYRRILMNPFLGAGESYMEGWWDCAELDTLFFRLLTSGIDEVAYRHWILRFGSFVNLLFNQQTYKKAQAVASKHYNLDNVLYRCMLGESMAYSCAYWSKASSLDEAQYHKYDLICRKLNLQKGDKVLEIGCGWGGFAKYATENYGCEIVAVNISSEQIYYAKEWCLGLPIIFYLCDWRKSSIYNPKQEKFDKILSVGMFEHVGCKNYNHFMRLVRNNLKNDGLFLLQTVGSNYSVNACNPWLNKYIFPNAMIPSLKQITANIENLFVVEDLHNFGANYDKTLLAWKKNVDLHWSQLSKRYDTQFYRMWTYYLLQCAGSCRAREGQLWQLILSPRGVLNGYSSLR